MALHSHISIMLQYTITALSILFTFIIGYFAGRNYAIIKRSDGTDAIGASTEKIKELLSSPSRQRVISPSKEKIARDLLAGLEEE